jgi:hypothetical protein
VNTGGERAVVVNVTNGVGSGEGSDEGDEGE